MIDTNFNITIECNTGELVTATWNYSQDHDNSNMWKIEHIDLPSNSWIVTLSMQTDDNDDDAMMMTDDDYVKYDITISTMHSNGAATEGSWGCSYSMQSCNLRSETDSDHEWTKVYNYEKYGYLISEMLLKGKWIWLDSYQTYNISCRKTNGKSK